MGDNGGYKAFLTDDLASGKFTVENANFVDGRFRHGTVQDLKVNMQEQQERHMSLQTAILKNQGKHYI